MINAPFILRLCTEVKIFCKIEPKSYIHIPESLARGEIIQISGFQSVVLAERFD